MGYELITNSAGTIAGYIESETGTLTQQQAEDAILCNKENPTDAEKQTAQAALDTFSGYALLRKQRNRLLAETDHWAYQDTPSMTQAQSDYRQALRDITNTYTSLDDVVCPLSRRVEMAYIGVDPNVGDITFQTFTGDGSATAFTLAQNVVSGEAILVVIGNIVQEPGLSKAYTAQGNTLTFSSAPANGDIIQVRYFGRAVDQPTSYAMQLFKYTATANQTAFTGADADGAILAFSGNDVDVYLNGVHLDSSDFTASNGDTITLGSGAAASDELVIRAFRAFTVTDTVSKASGGTFAGEITATSFQTTNTTVDTAAFRTNDQTVTENTTIGSTKNAMAVGPLTINSSVTLTVSGNLTIL